MSDQDQDRKLPAYVSWKTFLSSLDTLSEGVTDQIDRTVFPNMAGGVLGQLKAAYKSLGLTNQDGHTQEVLRKLAEDKDHRKTLMQAVLKNGYPEMFKLDLAKSSPQMISDAMKKTGATGDTLERAIRLPLSSHLKGRKKRVVSSPKRTNGGRGRQVTPRPDPLVEKKDTPQIKAQKSMLLWGMLQRLPEPGSVWPKMEREQWIATLQSIFAIDYKEKT
jgi:hypothetical protein